MPEKPAVITADLGPTASVFIANHHGKPVAVINTEVGRSAALRHQAVCALLGAGLDAGLIFGVIHGVRR